MHVLYRQCNVLCVYVVVRVFMYAFVYTICVGVECVYVQVSRLLNYG